MISVLELWNRIRYWRRRRLLVFLIPLPFPLPLLPKDIFAFVAPYGRTTPVNLFEPSTWPKIDSNLFYVSIRFWQVSTSNSAFSRAWEALDEVLARLKSAELGDALRDSTAPPTGSEDHLPGGFVSVAELATVFPHKKAGWRLERIDPDSDPISDSFDFGLIFLDRVIRSYRASQNHLIPRISHEQLPFIVPLIVRLVDRRNRTLDLTSLFTLHTRPPQIEELEALTDAELELLARHLDAQNRKHPFMAYKERVMETKVALFVQGDYSRAIVDAHTAAEVLLDNLLTVMLWEEGMNPAEAARSIFSKRLKSRVRQHYHSRLGGGWDTNGSNPVGQWAQICSPLRNRVVHSGYEAAKHQARICYDLTNGLEKYVINLMLRRLDTYPRTALMLIGQPGLEKRGLWTPALRQLAEDPTEPNWMESHDSWQQAMNESLQNAN